MFEGYRDVLLYGESPAAWELLYPFGISIAMLPPSSPCSAASRPLREADLMGAGPSEDPRRRPGVKFWLDRVQRPLTPALAGCAERAGRLGRSRTLT